MRLTDGDQEDLEWYHLLLLLTSTSHYRLDSDFIPRLSPPPPPAQRVAVMKEERSSCDW